MVRREGYALFILVEVLREPVRLLHGSMRVVVRVDAEQVAEPGGAVAAQLLAGQFAHKV